MEIKDYTSLAALIISIIGWHLNFRSSRTKHIETCVKLSTDIRKSHRDFISYNEKDTDKYYLLMSDFINTCEWACIYIIDNQNNFWTPKPVKELEIEITGYFKMNIPNGYKHYKDVILSEDKETSSYSAIKNILSKYKKDGKKLSDYYFRIES